MAEKDRVNIKADFEQDDRPIEAQFVDWIDSVLNRVDDLTTQAAPPGVNDDSSAGFKLFDIVKSTDEGRLYMAFDVSVGAAVWRDISTKTFPIWDSGFTYKQSDYVVHLGDIYVSLQNSNSGNSPEASPAYWLIFDPVGGGFFDVTKLAGYGTEISVVGDDSFNTTALVPILDDSNTGKLNIGTAEWHFGTLGIQTYTGQSAAGAPTTNNPIITVRTGTNWTQFASVPDGFYTIVLPGAGGLSIRFWFERKKWDQAFNGNDNEIHFDNAGVVWAVPSGGTFANDKIFVSGPNLPIGFSKNHIDLWGDDSENILTTFNPVIPSGGAQTRIVTNNVANWQATAIGSTTWTALSGIGGNFSNVSVVLFRAQSGFWETFSSDAPGVKEIIFPYTSNGVVQGFKLRFWYDQQRWEGAFKGNSADIYIDMLGNVWKGNPESGGEFVAGQFGAAQIGVSIIVNQLKELVLHPLYINGDDKNLNFPDDQYNTDANQPNLFGNTANGTRLLVGDFEWQATTFGATVTWSGQTAGSVYGSVVFQPLVGNWDNFSNVASGLKTIQLPKNANGGTEGGSFQYFYDLSAFMRAFDGNTADIVITLAGAVFKGSVSPENLVVNADGVLGPAGFPQVNQVSVSVADQVKNYLSSKLAAGTGINLNILNPAGDEQLEVENDAPFTALSASVKVIAGSPGAGEIQWMGAGPYTATFSHNFGLASPFEISVYAFIENGSDFDQEFPSRITAKANGNDVEIEMPNNNDLYVVAIATPKFTVSELIQVADWTGVAPNLVATVTHNFNLANPYEVGLKFYEVSGSDFNEIIPSRATAKANGNDVEVEMPVAIDVYVTMQR